MPQPPRDIAVIGLGSFGASVARELARFGDNVLGIDLDEAPAAALSGTLSRVVIADGRDERALRETGIEGYRVAVVAMASDLECSILSVMNARAIGVEQVWAKAADPTHERILQRLGADRVLQPEQQFGAHIAHMIHNPAVGDYVRLGHDLHFATVAVPEPFQGMSVDELQLDRRHKLRTLGLLREGGFREHEGDAGLQAGDSLLLLGPRSSIRAFADRF